MAKGSAMQQYFPIPHLSAFTIGFVYFFVSVKTIEISTIDNRLLLSLLNFVLISILIIMLRRFGKNIRDGLIITASLLSGILLGYLISSAFLWR